MHLESISERYFQTEDLQKQMVLAFFGSSSIASELKKVYSGFLQSTEHCFLIDFTK